VEISPDDLRRRLAALDARSRKVVAGLVTVMLRHPARVREREWMAEQLASVALLAGDVQADSAQRATAELQDWLRGRADGLLEAAFLLFGRAGLDLAPRAGTLTPAEALAHALSYLPDAQAPSEDRDLGPQPLARLMAERGLAPADLVAHSTEQLTHKQVARAMKGRRLTAHMMDKVLRAWNRATSGAATRADLFDYAP
jgi:hypothetical protein